MTEEEIEEQVRSRIERQEILARDNPPVFVAILDEGVLRRMIGTREVMAEQLVRLSEICTESRHLIQVVPEGVGMYPGLLGSFVIANVDGAEVAYLDTPVMGQVVRAEEHVAAVRKRWEVLRGETLSRRQSAQLIEKVAEEWKP